MIRDPDFRMVNALLLCEWLHKLGHIVCFSFSRQFGGATSLRLVWDPGIWSQHADTDCLRASNLWEGMICNVPFFGHIISCCVVSHFIVVRLANRGFTGISGVFGLGDFSFRSIKAVSTGFPG